MWRHSRWHRHVDAYSQLLQFGEKHKIYKTFRVWKGWWYFLRARFWILREHGFIIDDSFTLLLSRDSAKLNRKDSESDIRNPCKIQPYLFRPQGRVSERVRLIVTTSFLSLPRSHQLTHVRSFDHCSATHVLGSCLRSLKIVRALVNVTTTFVGVFADDVNWPEFSSKNMYKLVQIALTPRPRCQRLSFH